MGKVNRLLQKKIDIIAMSGIYCASENVKRALALGARDFILKPLDFNVFSKKLAYLQNRDENCSEWVINRSQFAVNGTISTRVELLSISEASLTTTSSYPITEGLSTNISFQCLQYFGISNLNIKLNSCEKFGSEFKSRFKIVGLSQSDAKKIRLLCRSLDACQVQLPLGQ